MPSGLLHARFELVPLTREYAALDYECYLSSPAVIETHSAGRWPTEAFSFEEDLVLIAQHERQHAAGESYAFVVLEPGRSRALGCVYLNPLDEFLDRAGRQPLDTPMAPGAAIATFWLRQDVHGSGLADDLVEEVTRWLRDEWRLAHHVFRAQADEEDSMAALTACRHISAITLALADGQPDYRWFANEFE